MLPTRSTPAPGVANNKESSPRPGAPDRLDPFEKYDPPQEKRSFFDAQTQSAIWFGAVSLAGVVGGAVPAMAQQPATVVAVEAEAGQPGLGFGDVPTQGPAETGAVGSNAVVTVDGWGQGENDSLANILRNQGYSDSEIFGGTRETPSLLHQVAENNGIEDPDLIYPGQQITVPHRTSDEALTFQDLVARAREYAEAGTTVEPQIGETAEVEAPQAPTARVTVDPWGQGPNSSLEGILKNQGYTQREIYTPNEQGKSLLDRVAEGNNLSSPNVIRDGQQLDIPVKSADAPTAETRAEAPQTQTRETPPASSRFKSIRELLNRAREEGGELIDRGGEFVDRAREEGGKWVDRAVEEGGEAISDLKDWGQKTGREVADYIRERLPERQSEPPAAEAPQEQPKESPFLTIRELLDQAKERGREAVDYVSERLPGGQQTPVQQNPQTNTVKVDPWGQGGNSSLEGILRNQGYSNEEIYRANEQGKTLLDRVAEGNNLQSADRIQAGQELDIPVRGTIGSPSLEETRGQEQDTGETKPLFPEIDFREILDRARDRVFGRPEQPAPHTHVTVERWGEGTNTSLVSILRNKGYTDQEIYTKDSSGRTLLERVAEQNRLQSPDLVYPGQELQIPLKGGAPSHQHETPQTPRTEAPETPRTETPETPRTEAPREERILDVRVDGWRKGPNDSLEQILLNQGWSHRDIYRKDRFGRTAIERVALANGMSDPNNIYAGAVMQIPTSLAQLENNMRVPDPPPRVETPRVEQPETPRVEQPETPRVEQPETPRVEQPETPRVEQPETPRVEQPETPRVEQPETPRVEQPETPRVEEPSDSLGEPTANMGLLIDGARQGKFKRDEFQVLNALSNRYAETRARYSQDGFTNEELTSLGRWERRYGAEYARLWDRNDVPIRVEPGSAGDADSQTRMRHYTESGEFYDAYMSGRATIEDGVNLMMRQRSESRRLGGQ